MSRALGEVGAPLLKQYRQPSVKTPMKKVNKERKAKMDERNFGPHGVFIRLEPCVVATHAHPSLRTDCLGKVMACHLVARGMGGCNGDRFSLFPACAQHHLEQTNSTADFQARYDLDLPVLVEYYNLKDPGVSEEDKEAARRRLEVLREPR